MVCKEGGLEECFEVIFSILEAKISEKNENCKLDLFMKELDKIEDLYTKGVMQSIGYKEFVPLFRSEANIWSKEYLDFMAFYQKMKERASKITEEYNDNNLF